MLLEMRTWLDGHDYESVEHLKGSMSSGASPNPDAFVRANYMKMLTTYTTSPQYAPPVRVSHRSGPRR
ncbi:MAG: hypothetical protein ACR2N2_08990 [Acidimicrobiia bacterium]